MLFICVLNAYNFFHEKNKIKNCPDNLNIYSTHETQQIWLNYLQGGDRELHRLLKYVQIKQTVKICSFGLACWFLRWNLKQRLHITLRPCYEIKSFPKKLTKFTLSANYFSQAGQMLNCFPFPDNLAFCRHGLSVFTKLDLLLLTSVNIKNRGD